MNFWRVSFRISLICALILGQFLPILAHAQNFPKKANYYIRWDLNEAQVKELAKWDLLILDMETQVNSRELLKKLRVLNPSILLYVYITPQDIRTDAAQSPSVLRRKLASGIAEEWYVTNQDGKKFSSWPGMVMLNVADNAPAVNGVRYNQYLAKFVNDELLSTGLWDGVFFDNAWEGVSWFGGKNFDLDKDGVNDSDPDSHWINGARFVYEETRRLNGGKYLVMANGGTKVYRSQLNGLMLETFPNYGGWKGTMDIYSAYEKEKQFFPQTMVVNRNTQNNLGRKDDYRSVRYGLASTLLGNGYFSFDYGDQDHSQTWWYDEYNVNLGDPIGEAVSLLGSTAKFNENDVWRREYTNGVAVVNPSNESKNVDLGSDYEKIIGQQDSRINNGVITDRITLPAKDGIVMMKTLQKIKNAVFENGAFIRFFDFKGNRSRNGLFAFEEGYKGGARIYAGDLDGENGDEKIVVTGPRLEIFNSQGERIFNTLPYGDEYTGDMNIAVGALLPGKEKQIVVAPSVGGKIILYNSRGNIINAGVYPYGSKYVGGFSVAIGRAKGNVPGKIIVASGKGRTSEVLIYTSDFSRIEKFFRPYYASLKTGISVAAGDINGDGEDELAVIPTYHTTPYVRWFTFSGKLISQFTVGRNFTQGTMSLSITDVNKNGVQELEVMSQN